MDAPSFHDLPDEWAVPLATALVNGRCSRPVETAGGFLVRCGSRRVAVCPSCAEMVRGDWAAIARSGVFDPPTGRRFRFYLLTLTAPSFGRVHSIPNAAKGHESRRCRCGVRHTEADAALSGVPVDPDAYDYAGAVAFNYGFGRLWNNTKTRLRDAWESLAFFAVREWQDRGVLHLHAIIRIDAFEAGPPSLVESRAKSATARNPFDGSVLRWGAQSKCDPLTTDGDGARSIWYVSKVIGYAHKDLGFKYGERVPAERLAHLARLGQAAREIRCDAVRVDQAGVVHECDGASCTAKLHENYGARGHVVTYSRQTSKRAGWSLTGLTRRAQRQNRLAWVMEHQAERWSAEDFADAVRARSWLGRRRWRSAGRPSPARAP